MNQPKVFLTVVVTMVLLFGCSSGNRNPILNPVDDESGDQLTGNAIEAPKSSTCLWGYYDLNFDFKNMTVEATPVRSVEFTANIVTFLNNDPKGLQVKVNGATPGADYVDIDLDITIKHPLSVHAYDGYDVRGIFIGNGTAVTDYNPDLTCAAYGIDQVLLNADGYTRWFNPTEFQVPGIFGYTPGKMASNDYAGTATLNPYKYFGDGLGSYENLWDYLNSGNPQAGYFLAGTSNTRNHKIRFPIPSPGVKFGYAVIANWVGPKPKDHPSHAPEAMSVKLVDNSDVYYTDSVTNGGDVILDISVFDWNAELSAGVMEDYQIIVGSTVQSVPHELNTSEMTPIASGDHWYTFHVEIPADDIHSADGNEIGIAIEDSNADYSNPADVPNSAEGDPLAGFFRFPLAVSSEEPLWIEVASPNGGEFWKVGDSGEIMWNSNPDIENVTILLSLNSGADYTQAISLSTPNDGSFTWDPIPPEAAGGACRIRVSDAGDTGIYDDSDANFAIAMPGMHVIQPNGGELWKASTAEEITWVTDADISHVIILLSQNSGYSYPKIISLSTPNDGSFMWDPIPASAISQQDRIMIRSTENYNLFDSSNTDFTVSSPLINVISPDGDEHWKSGTPHGITWVADSDIANVKIELSINSGSDFTYVITPSTPNSGIFPWDPVPFGINSENCRIKISDTDCPDVFAISDADFEVFDPWILLTSPNGGENLEAYMNWEITWDSSETGGTVNLEYSKDDFISDFHIIAINTPNDGSYIWENIPFDLSDTVSMRIVCPGPPMSDYSDADFSIV
ncbi:MAG: hypothetical protein ABIC40_01155 [bacterium]